MLGWGGFATSCLAPAAGTVRMPDAMSFEHGAAFGVVYQTSYFGLVYRAALQPGETLLVHAAAGGVGLAAVQIGKALGARVLATAGSAAKLDDRAPARRRSGVRLLDARLGRAGEGGDRRARRRRHLRSGRRRHRRPVDQVHRLQRPLAGHRLRLGRIPSVQLNRVLLKNIAIVGLHWGAYRQHDPEKIPQAMRALFALYERGLVTPLVSSQYPLARAAEALEEIASRRSVGKVLLIP